jgi:putative transposase
MLIKCTVTVILVTVILGEDGLTYVAPALSRVLRIRDLLDGPAEARGFAALRQAEVIGRPLGSEAFVKGLEEQLERRLLPQKRGRRPSAGETVAKR